MKSYTDLEQSKKLTEILSKDSADMYYMETSPNNYTIGVLQRMERDMLLNQSEYYKMFPCWSLTALLNVLPSATLDSSDDHYFRFHCMERYTEWFDSPVDACYEMILKLKELKLLFAK